jgi:hypothetical protein
MDTMAVSAQRISKTQKKAAHRTAFVETGSIYIFN